MRYGLLFMGVLLVACGAPDSTQQARDQPSTTATQDTAYPLPVSYPVGYPAPSPDADAGYPMRAPTITTEPTFAPTAPATPSPTITPAIHVADTPPTASALSTVPPILSVATDAAVASTNVVTATVLTTPTDLAVTTLTLTTVAMQATPTPDIETTQAPGIPLNIPPLPADRAAYPEAIATWLNSDPRHRDQLVTLIIAWELQVYHPHLAALIGEAVVESDLDNDGQSETVVITPVGQLVVFWRDAAGRYMPQSYDLHSAIARIIRLEDLTNDGQPEILIDSYDPEQLAPAYTWRKRLRVLNWSAAGFRSLLAAPNQDGLVLHTYRSGQGISLRIYDDDTNGLRDLRINDGGQTYRWDGTAYRLASPDTIPWPAPTPTALPSAPPPQEGAIIYLAPDRTSVMRIRPDGSNVERLFSIAWATGQHLIGMQAAPNGTHIAYLIATTDMPNIDLYLADTTGTAIKLLSSPQPFWGWSPDGRWLWGMLADGAAFRYDVVEQRLVTAQIDGFQAWLPDGDHALALRNGQIYRHTLSSGQVEQLSDFYYYYPDQKLFWDAYDAIGFSQLRLTSILVAPDGTAYIIGNRQMEIEMSGNGGIPWRIGRLSGQRGSPQWLPGYGGNRLPLFSPYGTFFSSESYLHVSAFCSTAGLQIVRVDPDDHYYAYIPLLDKDQARNLNVYIEGVSWSPDERRVVFATRAYVCENEATPTPFTPHLYVWDVDVNDPRNVPQPRLLADGLWPSWVRDPAE
jgi:hypothetical protein